MAHTRSGTCWSYRRSTGTSVHKSNRACQSRCLGRLRAAHLSNRTVSNNYTLDGLHRSMDSGRGKWQRSVASKGQQANIINAIRDRRAEVHACVWRRRRAGLKDDEGRGSWALTGKARVQRGWRGRRQREGGRLVQRSRSSRDWSLENLIGCSSSTRGSKSVGRAASATPTYVEEQRSRERRDGERCRRRS